MLAAYKIEIISAIPDSILFFTWCLPFIVYCAIYVILTVFYIVERLFKLPSILRRFTGITTIILNFLRLLCGFNFAKNTPDSFYEQNAREKGFAEFYNKEIAQFTKTSEEERLKILKNFRKTFFVLLALLLFILILELSYLKKVLFVWGYLSLSSSYLMLKCRDFLFFKRKVKDHIFPKFLKFFGEIQYLTEDDFVDERKTLINKDIRIVIEEQILGKYKSVNFLIEELKLSTIEERMFFSASRHISILIDHKKILRAERL